MYTFVLAKLREVPKGYASKRAYWRFVEQGSKVPLKTIEKIARLQTEDPNVSTVERLAEFFGYTPHKAAALVRRLDGQLPTLAAA